MGSICQLIISKASFQGDIDEGQNLFYFENSYRKYLFPGVCVTVGKETVEVKKK
jgi:hypothetical protein